MLPRTAAAKSSAGSSPGAGGAPPLRRRRGAPAAEELEDLQRVRPEQQGDDADEQQGATAEAHPAAAGDHPAEPAATPADVDDVAAPAALLPAHGLASMGERGVPAMADEVRRRRSGAPRGGATLEPGPGRRV